MASKQCVPTAVAALLKTAPADPFERLQTLRNALYSNVAQDSLLVSQQKDARCLSCHSPNEVEQHVEHVSCETCHGGGQYYGAVYVMKDPELARLAGLVDPSEKSCRTCHDASSPSLKPFDFVEKLKLIDHWTVERQKRAAADPKKK